MKALQRATLAAATILSLSAQAGLAQNEAPPAGSVSFDDVSYRGSGCKGNTVSKVMASDARAFTLIFADFAVDSSTRGGRPSRRSCDIDVRLRVPEGWSFTVFGLDVRGYAALQQGAVGVIKTLSSFGRMQPQEVGRQRLEGPFDGDYQRYTDLPLTALEWSPCGADRIRKFNLKTAITVRPKNGFRDDQGEADNPGLGNGFPSGYMTVDSIDGSIRQEYRVAWKRCDGGNGNGGVARATCTLTAGNRTFTESAEKQTQQAAKNHATQKVVNTCSLALQGRPAQQQCKPERAVCRFD